MNGLLHIFTREEEEGTALFLHLNASAEAIFCGKLIFNILLFLALEVLVVPLYLFFLQVPVKNPPLLILTVFSGGLAISGSVTLLAAMVAKAGEGIPLYGYILPGNFAGSLGMYCHYISII